VRAALAALWLAPRFSLEAVQQTGAALGALGWKLAGRRNRRLLEHLEIAFPEADQPERQRIAAESWSSMGRLFMEALWAPAWQQERDSQRIRIATPDEWEQTLRMTRERGRGLVVFAAHLGAMEILAHWFPQTIGMEVMAVAARPKLDALEGPSRRLRESGGLKLVYRGEAGTAALRHLRAGGVLLMLADHNLKGPGVQVPFFGRPAHTLLAPARLALQCGGVANTMFCLREGVGRFRLECGQPFFLESPPRDAEARFRAEARLTLDYTQRIEAAIRLAPEQYLWMHKRWEKRSDSLPLPPSL
jgi:KDO2-lipid IV(A) lauroyltransferase